MSIPKPHFELARVYDDGTRETEIVSVVALPWDTRMDRRGFLGAGATAGAVLGALTACAPAPVAEPRVPPRTPKAETPSKVQPRPVVPKAQTIPAVRGNCGGLAAHTDTVTALAISPDGKLLASSGADRMIKLWNLPHGSLHKTLQGHKSTVNALAISPDGKLLASGGSDDTIKLWSLPEGALRNTLRGHKSDVHALAISPDGKLLASGSNDSTIKLWGLPKGALRKTLAGHWSAIGTLAISPNGELLASGSLDKTIRLWSLPQGESRKTLEGHEGAVRALAISADGKFLVSGIGDNTISLWTLPEGVLHKTLEDRKSPVNALAINPDGTLLVSSSEDHGYGAKLWSLPQGALRKTLEGHKSSVKALAISLDGTLLASGSQDKTIMLWGLPDGESKSCLADLSSMPVQAKGTTYQYRNEYGQIVTYTLPCGAPIPAGAVCTCNCVPGSYGPPASAPTPSGAGRYCTCVPVCVCMAVPVCQAHRVLHEEPSVRTMAEELLLVMGAREFEYMAWAADRAGLALKTRIRKIMAAIEAGALPDPGRWPARDECVARLDDPDDVIALMAAQLLAQKTMRSGLQLDDERSRRVRTLIREANDRSPFPRSCAQCTSWCVRRPSNSVSKRRGPFRSIRW